MKVVVCSTHVFWPSHCERDLELIQLHIDAGDDVTQVVCKREFDRCDFHLSLGPNPSEKDVRARCGYCIDRLKRSQDLIVGKWRVLRYHDLPGWTGFKAPKIGPFHDIDELQTFEHDGFEAGLGVASALISYSRITRPDMAGYSEHIERSVESALRLHTSFRKLLARERPDVVYVFNGRFSHTRAIFKACAREGIRCLVHEAGSSIARYVTLENSLPHDRDNFERLVRKAWDGGRDNPDERRKAERWYEDRAGGMDQAWFSYVKNQDPSVLPPEWVASRPKLVVFTSSEDEFAALGPTWKNPLFSGQTEGLRILGGLVREVRPEADLVIRMHPGLSSVKDPEVARILTLAGPGVIVIPPDSKVSTYRLLRECETALSFGSTMGIEAVFWKKPSVLLGPSMYKPLGGTYAPASIEELRSLLARKLEPLDSEGALMFAYYLSTYGTPYRYYEPTAILKGSYRGVDLEAHTYNPLSQRIRRGVLARIRSAMTVVIGASAAAAMVEWYRRLSRKAWSAR